jgi:presenilin-like A22 family membrane protease
MVGLFKSMVQKDVFFAYIIPPRKHEWMYSLSFVEEGRVRYMFLGTGDVIAPMLITVPLSLVNINLVWYVLSGATLAIIVMFYIIRSSEKHRALAGIPFISAGMLLGYLVYTIMG